MNGDGTWLDDSGQRAQVNDNDESVSWVRNTEENWFNNNPQPPNQLHNNNQNDFRFNSGGFPLNPSENLLLFTLDATPQQQQQQQSFLPTTTCMASLLNIPTTTTTTNNNNPFDELGFSSGFLGQTLNQTPNFSPPSNRFTPLEFTGVAEGVFENRAKVLKPLDVLASSTSLQPTLFQKRAAMRQSSSSKTCNSESSSEMMRMRSLSYERDQIDDASISDDEEEHNNNNNNKGKKKKKGMPAKNLMAERRRRKKLNDRLYMLRSVVPKISKMDRASILGDAIDYLKELLQRINDLHTELETSPSALPSSSMLTTYPVKEELCMSSSLPSPRGQEARIEVKLREGKAVNIHMFCGRRPGLLLSTMRALDNLGLDVQQAVVSCFNGFALDVFRAEQCQEGHDVVPEQIKAVLLDTVGYAGLV